MAITGCTAKGPGFAPQTRIIATQGPEDNVFIVPALDRTAQEFLGLSGSGPSPPPRDGPAVVIRPDMLSPGSETAYRLVQSRSRSVGLQAEQPLGRTLSATARLTVGEGRTAYALPQGLGILRDPANIRFKTRFATVESGIAWRREVWPGVSGQVEMAFGMRHTRTGTHVSSALLDVRSKSRQRDSYIALRGGFDVRPVQDRGAEVHLGTEARFFPGKGVTLGQTLELSY